MTSVVTNRISSSPFSVDNQLLSVLKVKELEGKIRDHDHEASESISLQQKVSKFFPWMI